MTLILDCWNLPRGRQFSFKAWWINCWLLHWLECSSSFWKATPSGMWAQGWRLSTGSSSCHANIMLNIVAELGYFLNERPAKPRHRPRIWRSKGVEWFCWMKLSRISRMRMDSDSSPRSAILSTLATLSRCFELRAVLRREPRTSVLTTGSTVVEDFNSRMVF